MRNPKILLVDDEESIRLSFCRDFEHEGYLVTTAASGEEAIEILQKDHFDLVISDLSMPGIGGIGVLQETKKQDPETGTMILTGYGDMNTAIEALRLGADDYLLKPCDIDELLLRVTRCLEKQEAFRKVKQYETILPICSFCKQIRNDEDNYEPVEDYLHKHSGLGFSHTICPVCYKKHYPEEFRKSVSNSQHRD